MGLWCNLVATTDLKSVALCVPVRVRPVLPHIASYRRNESVTRIVDLDRISNDLMADRSFYLIKLQLHQYTPILSKIESLTSQPDNK